MLDNAKAVERNKKKVAKIYEEIGGGKITLSLPTSSQIEEEKRILKHIKDTYGSVENVPLKYVPRYSSQGGIKIPKFITDICEEGK